MSIAFDKLKCWTPCEEGLPCKLEPVLITYKNNEPESYYANIKGKPFTDVRIYSQNTVALSRTLWTKALKLLHGHRYRHRMKIAIDN